jgi:hypothetical protein
MDFKNNTKLKIYSIGVLFSLLVLSVIFLGVNSILIGELIFGIFSIVISVVIVLYSIYVLRRYYILKKRGVTFHKQSLREIMVLAGYRGFMISILWLLVLSWIADFGLISFRNFSGVFGIGIFGMVIIFGLCWLWINYIDNKKKLQSKK